MVNAIIGIVGIFIQLVGLVHPQEPPQVPPPTTAPSQTTLASGFPVSAAEVAAQFGGTAAEWSPVDPSGWHYQSMGSGALRFTVPDACLVTIPSGTLRPGESADATALTIYWLRSSSPRTDRVGAQPGR